VPALILIYDRGPTTAGDKAQSWRTKTKCKPAYLGVHIVALVDLGLPNCWMKVVLCVTVELSGYVSLNGATSNHRPRITDTKVVMLAYIRNPEEFVR